MLAYTVIDKTQRQSTGPARLHLHATTVITKAFQDKPKPRKT